jgi:hypothetical protein
VIMLMLVFWVVTPVDLQVDINAYDERTAEAVETEAVCFSETLVYTYSPHALQPRRPTTTTPVPT